MAKNIIEKAPFKFDYKLYDLQKNIDYFQKYNATDDKGEYLHWDKFRYTIDVKDDKNIAWWATKLKRNNLYKVTILEDKDKNFFRFCIPDVLQSKLHKIIKNTQQGIVPHSSIQNHFLISSLILEESISSSQLEGAVTSSRVAKEMLVSKRKPKNEDEQMIFNNYLLMKMAKNQKESILSLDLIRSFHKIATSKTTHNRVIGGEFRSDNEINISDYDGNVIFQPQTFDTIEHSLMILCHFGNTNHDGMNGNIFIDPIVKAVILHFMIGYIHPFNDGNGRTARALFYWYMLKNGFDYFEFVSISKLLKDAPKQYALSYLYSEDDDGDLTYFIVYQVNVILRAIDELLEYLKKKGDECEEGLKIFSKSKYNDLLNFVQKNIMQKAIKESGRIFTANEIASDYGISQNSARNYLNKLSDYGLLIKTKNKQNFIYIATNTIKELISKE